MRQSNLIGYLFIHRNRQHTGESYMKNEITNLNFSYQCTSTVAQMRIARALQTHKHPHFWNLKKKRKKKETSKIKTQTNIKMETTFRQILLF